MEEILIKRVELRKKALKAVCDSTKASYEAGVLDVAEGRAILKRLKDLIYTLDVEIKEYTVKSIEHNVDIVDTALSCQIEAEALCSQMEHSLTDVAYVTTKENPEALATAKLPKLQLPTYAGDKLKWTEFWDRFRANIHDKNIAEADKLSYLIGCLSGDALEAVSGLTTTNENYSIAIETLQTRFGSKDAIIDAHYTELANMTRAKDESKSCRTALNEIEKHLRVLEKLGEPANGNNLRAMILRKFPDRVVHELHLIGTDNSMANIRLGLQKIITAMEKSAAVLSDVDEKEGTWNPGTSTGTTAALNIRTENAVPDKRKHLKRKGQPLDRGQKKKARRPCLFCRLTNHASAECKRFASVEARKRKLQGRCLKCLRRNHKTEDCKGTISCFRCKGPHFRLLCPEQRGTQESSITTAPETLCNFSNGFTFLQTAVAHIQNPKEGLSQIGRIILDSGSQRSYITKKLADLLNVPIMKTDLLMIYTFGASTPHQRSSPLAEIEIETKRGIKHRVHVNIVPHITDRIPIAKIHHKDVDIYADDETAGEGIDLLIGNDFYSSFIREKRFKMSENLYVIDTDFGYIVSGNVTSHKDNIDDGVLSVNTYCQCHTPNCPYFTEPDLPLRTVDISFLWSLESIGITDSPRATRHEEAVYKFNETVRYKDNRYEVKWPWIQHPPELPSNFGLAIGRLRSLMSRIDEESLNEYKDILEEQLNLGVIEVVSPTDMNNSSHPIHYLPHNIIKQKGKRGRIVYDASARLSGCKSLNECLYSGPYMLEDLTALLLQFRTRKIGITADVEKAFLQVGLHEEDRDVTRFLWPKDTSKELTDDNLMCYRFCRVAFGLISSPFLLTATIKHHMMQSEDDVIKSIADKCYVDNLVTGADTIDEAREIYEKARTAFNQLSMNIRDWTSNSRELLTSIPTQHQYDREKEVKVLGLSWDINDDKLKLRWVENQLYQDSPIDTKRKVLRALARVYDPCGFVCPLVLPMKLLFQAICEQKCKWDKTLPDDIMQSLERILVNLNDVTKVELPRHLGTVPSNASMVYELHGFSDASKDSFAAVVYVKVTGEQGSSVSFVMAKSRVAQSKDKKEKAVNIPRLELLGFLITSRLLKYVKANLGIPIHKEFLWTDSLVVLGWMRSTKLLPPFVANRVEEVKKNLPQALWYYINTSSNPADLATRPENWEQKKEMWFNGPEFLKSDETHWPTNRHYDSHHSTLFSAGEVMDQCPSEEPMDTGETLSPGQPNNDLMELDIPEENIEACTTKETSNIKKLQKECYPEELEGKRTHLARNLDVFLDVDGILRTRGRMGNTSWSYDMKHPILLPRDADFTRKVIKDTHESNYHVGAPHTLSIIRRKYWIPQGKSQVQKIIKQCSKCIKHGGGPYKLPSAPALPEERVTYHTPFTFTGTDYLGPLYVVNSSNEKVKRWVALFTCLTVRAIHLEVVSDLTAEECLMSIRRFAATKNTPRKIYSDNATYFRLTSEVMKHPYCIEKCIEWKFIPQLAPWHGGFYERLVGLVKHCLKRTLEKHLLNDSQLLTVIKEVESVVNSRPLTKVGPELDHVLSPSDFLSLGKCVTINPTTVETPASGTRLKVDLITSWKRGLMILEEFKKMFVGQYLTSLRERFHQDPKQPRVRSHRVPHLEDLVQIKDDSKNRNNWKVGKIVDLIKGADGECRVAKIKVNDSVFTRSIGHLYPLEADVDETGNPDKALNMDTTKEQFSVVPPDFNEQEIPVHNAEVDVDSTRGDDEHLSINVNSDSDMSRGKSTELCTSGHNDEADLTTSHDIPPVGTGEKRGAAIRAREKILEWTKQLFTLMK